MKTQRLVGLLLLLCLIASGDALGQQEFSAPRGKQQWAEAITNAMPSEANAPPKARKVLVFYLCKGYRHRSISLINSALEIMGKKTGAFETVASDDMSVFNSETLKTFDAIVWNNATRLTFDPSQRDALMGFVGDGKGVVGIHAAIDSFYEWPEAREMMGGVFESHPWTRDGTWAIAIESPEHKLTRAFQGKGFKICDEIYKVKDLSKERTHVLLALDMDDEATLGALYAKAGKKKPNAKGANVEAPPKVKPAEDPPIAWAHNFGKGRVFYCPFGHNNEVLLNPQLLKFMLDGIQYAIGDLQLDEQAPTDDEG